MMRSFFLAVVTSALVATTAHAQTPTASLSLNFDKVPVIQLLQATYRNMLGKNYIIDPALSGDARVVTLSVKDLPKDQLKPTVDAVLRESGIAIKEVGGIPYFYQSGKSQVGLGGGVPALDSPLPVPSHDGTPTAGQTGGNAVAGQSGAVAGPLQAPAMDFEETRFYEPRYRVPDQLQVIANAMLGTQFAPSDKVTLAGTLERVEKVAKLLDQYDTLPPEVIAKALVFEFSDSTNEGSGFQLALNVLAGKLSIGIGGAVSPGENFARFKNQTIDAVLSAVSGDGRFKLQSAPSIRVKDGAKGRITVGADVPVLAEAQLDKNGNPVQSVQYRPSGVIFDIAPRIMRDRIELNLSQQLSNFQQTSTSKINSPTLTKREVSTVIGIESGDMILLGGLDESKSNETRQGLSFLPRFLDTTKTENSKSQVLVVLQVTKIDQAKGGQ